MAVDRDLAKYLTLMGVPMTVSGGMTKNMEMVNSTILMGPGMWVNGAEMSEKEMEAISILMVTNMREIGTKIFKMVLGPTIMQMATFTKVTG